MGLWDSETRRDSCIVCLQKHKPERQRCPRGRDVEVDMVPFLNAAAQRGVRDRRLRTNRILARGTSPPNILTEGSFDMEISEAGGVSPAKWRASLVAM